MNVENVEGQQPMKPVIINRVNDRLSVGVNIYNNVSLKSLTALMEYIETEVGTISNKFKTQLPPGFSFSRRLYRAFSTDPTKHRPSSEALWRRIKKGNSFPFVNSFVDLTNLLSLKFQVPYGLYDLSKVQGGIEIDQGGEGESYQGIRKDIVNLDGKILLRDETGPFGNPSSDSLRTSTSSETRHILQVIFFHIDYPQKEEVLAESLHRFLEFFNGETHQSSILD